MARVRSGQALQCRKTTSIARKAVIFSPTAKSSLLTLQGRQCWRASFCPTVRMLDRPSRSTGLLPGKKAAPKSKNTGSGSQDSKWAN